MNKSIILWRHIVVVAIVLAIHSGVVSVRRGESVGGFVGYWAGSIVIAFGIAGAISGLGYLFFTSYQKGKVIRTFIICAWVIAGCLLFGRWVLPGVVEQIKTSDSRSAETDYHRFMTKQESEHADPDREILRSALMKPDPKHPDFRSARRQQRDADDVLKDELIDLFGAAGEYLGVSYQLSYVDQTECRQYPFKQDSANAFSISKTAVSKMIHGSMFNDLLKALEPTYGQLRMEVDELIGSTPTAFQCGKAKGITAKSFEQSQNNWLHAIKRFNQAKQDQGLTQ